MLLCRRLIRQLMARASLCLACVRHVIAATLCADEGVLCTEVQKYLPSLCIWRTRFSVNGVLEYVAHLLQAQRSLMCVMKVSHKSVGICRTLVSTILWYMLQERIGESIATAPR